MTGTVLPMRCHICGEAATSTPAALAAGGAHPRCVLPARLRASLTASGGARGPEEFILARWALRTALRSSEAAAPPRTAAERTIVAASNREATPSPPKGAPAERKLPDEIVNAIRLIAIAESAGVKARAFAVQKTAEQVMGASATRATWGLLVSTDVLRFNPRRSLEATTMAAVDQNAWALLRQGLLERGRRARR